MTAPTALASRPGLWAAASCSMLLLAGCAEPPQIMDAWLSADDVTLDLMIDTCNADLTPEVEYTGSFVYVTVDAENDHTGDACADGLTIVLDAPLAGRQLVDGRTGDPIVPKMREDG